MVILQTGLPIILILLFDFIEGESLLLLLDSKGIFVLVVQHVHRVLLGRHMYY